MAKNITHFGLVTLGPLYNLLSGLPLPNGEVHAEGELERMCSVLQLHHTEGIDRLYSMRLMTLAFSLTGRRYSEFEELLDNAEWAQPGVMTDQIGDHPMIELMDGDSYSTTQVLFWLFERWAETIPIEPVYTLDQLRVAIEMSETMLDNMDAMPVAANQSVH